MRKIGEGDKSEVFALPDGRILKLFFRHHAPLAAVEAHLSGLLARAGVLAPRVEETVTLDGRPGIVFGNLREGRTLSGLIRSRPWQIRSRAQWLAALHAAVHECTAPDLPSLRERAEDQIRSSTALPAEAQEAALQALSSLPDGDAVCHNDLHMLNVIVYPDGGMIIDWVLAARGDPLADVATAFLQLGFGERPKGWLAAAPLELGRTLFRDAYLERYLKLRSCRREEVARWELPMAAALAGRRAGRMRRQLLMRIQQLLGSEEWAGGRRSEAPSTEAEPR